MFAEPVSLSVGTETESLARVGFNPGKFQTVSGDLVLTVSHATTKNNRTRSIMRVDRMINVADPLTATLVRRIKDTVYIVLDSASSATGITAVEREKTVGALLGFINDATGRNKFVGGES